MIWGSAEVKKWNETSKIELANMVGYGGRHRQVAGGSRATS